VTGCPKIRAMEIIDELERSPRGVYCGAMVSMGKEDLTASVAIRTMTLPPAPTEEGMRRVWMPVGGGIVADSVPAEEWEETEVKAEGMRGVLRGKGI
jgi:anthranilate/para-aminobenzoate synthase component I